MLYCATAILSPASSFDTEFAPRDLRVLLFPRGAGVPYGSTSEVNARRMTDRTPLLTRARGEEMDAFVG